jgi:hypothetical protein
MSIWEALCESYEKVNYRPLFRTQDMEQFFL